MTDRTDRLPARPVAAREVKTTSGDTWPDPADQRATRAAANPEAVIAEAHGAERESLARFLSRARPSVVLTAPVIYSLILPILLLDLFVTLYQAICFPVYGIARVRRRDHIAVDRHRLAYLNIVQKVNCAYCGYANGVLGYAREIASRTEAYWCPIKHARRVAEPHARMSGFADYGDRGGFAAETARQRARLKD